MFSKGKIHLQEKHETVSYLCLEGLLAVGHFKFLSGQIGMNVQNFYRHFLYHSQNISVSKPAVSHQLQPSAQLVKAFTIVLYRTGMFRTICLHVYVINATEASLQNGSDTTKRYDSILVISLYLANHKKRANVTLV